MTIAGDRTSGHGCARINGPEKPSKMLQKQVAKAGDVACAKTVPKCDSVTVLGLTSSEKQIPQFVENTEKPK